MNDALSPLRYPGSKSNLADYFETFIKENLLLGAHLYEPYAGGASISLNMVARGLVAKATLIEKDPLVFSFWKCILENPEGLCEKVQKAKVTLETWKAFRKYLAPDALQRFPAMELGFAGLFFNRTCFSGIIGAGPIGGMSQGSDYKINCRFNKDRIIPQILEVAKFKKKLSVVHGDALEFLHKNRSKISKGHSLVYIDPPYFQQGRRLYRYHYLLEQHKKLADFINRETYPWIVSYDNHPVIVDFFSHQKIVPIFLNYTVKRSRKAEELLISNFKLNLPIYEDSQGNIIEVEPLRLSAIAM